MSRGYGMVVAVRFLLVHSPLVGPATWRWVANVLTASGHDVVVPDLREAAMSGDPHALIAAARERASREPSVMVGHSGAGFFLPAIAAGLEARQLVFVDAGLPPCSGEASPSKEFIDSLRALAVDGVLPKWSTWWDDGVMEALVPHEDHRADVEAELPEIPLSLYESPIAVSPGWCSAPCGYLLLSEPYRQDAAKAVSLGWPVIERLGTHLDIINDPRPMAHAIVDLADLPEPTS